MKLITFDQQFKGTVLGVDEAGRGPLAGPVVVAAVIIKDYQQLPLDLNDSKKLSRTLREKIYSDIIENSFYKLSIIDSNIIDKINILEATKLGMAEAIQGLSDHFPNHILIDGNQLPHLRLESKYHPIIDGDNLSASIAAASILAKVTRDSIMAKLSLSHPEYGWEKNAGYGTKQHLESIEKFGITEYHRKSFRPVKQRLQHA
jgi:ribonuclease HII